MPKSKRSIRYLPHTPNSASDINESTSYVDSISQNSEMLIGKYIAPTSSRTFIQGKVPVNISQRRSGSHNNSIHGYGQNVNSLNKKREPRPQTTIRRIPAVEGKQGSLKPNFKNREWRDPATEFEMAFRGSKGQLLNIEDISSPQLTPEASFDGNTTTIFR